MFTAVNTEASVPADRQSPERGGRSYAGPERRRIVAAAFDPVYVGRFVWRWRWFLGFATLLGLSAGIALALSTPKTYVSGTQILLDPRDIKVVQNEVAPNALPSDATLALVESQMALVTSSRVMSDVIGKAGLEDDPEFGAASRSGLARLLPSLFATKAAPPEERRANLEAALRRALTVSREPKSFIITLLVTTQSPDKSARLANLFTDAFIAEIGRIQSDTARRATVALSSRLSELRRSVVESEGKVEDYKTTNALIGVNGRLVDDEYITRVNEGLARARADLTAIRVRAESLKRTGVDDVVKGGLPEELSSDALMRLRQSYSDLAQAAGGLAAKLGPRHPQRIVIEGALASARESIRLELARIVAAGQTELARAQTVERDLTAQVNGLKEKQVETSGSFVKLRELEREVDASRAVYEAFLLRARETSEQESLNTANIRVISEATPPLRPVGPPRTLMIVAGGIVGFVLGTALVVCIAMMRLVVGFLRQDRRGGSGTDRSVWTEADRAAHRRATAPDAASAPPKADAPALGEPMILDAPPATTQADDRPGLRERIRSIAEAADKASPSQRREADIIQRELESVRDALAEIRLARARS